jgi:hypothetical protein
LSRRQFQNGVAVCLGHREDEIGIQRNLRVQLSRSKM